VVLASSAPLEVPHDATCIAVEHQRQARLLVMARDGSVATRQAVRTEGSLNFLVRCSGDTNSGRGVDPGPRYRGLRRKPRWQSDHDTDRANEDSCVTG
jgi:hypothetical protein